jgi:hypothetical protein
MEASPNRPVVLALRGAPRQARMPVKSSLMILTCLHSAANSLTWVKLLATRRLIIEMWRMLR